MKALPQRKNIRLSSIQIEVFSDYLDLSDKYFGVALVAQFKDVVRIDVDLQKPFESTDERGVGGKGVQIKVATGTPNSIRLQASHVSWPIPVALVVGEPQASRYRPVRLLNTRQCGSYSELSCGSRVIFLPSAKRFDRERGVMRQTKRVFRRERSRTQSRLRAIEGVTDIA